MPSNVTLEQIQLIHYCWITGRFRTCGVSTFITLVLLSGCYIIHSGLIAGGKDTKEGRQAVFFTAVNPMTDSQEDEPLDVRKPRKVLYRTKWKVFQDALCWINLRNAQDKGSELWQTRFNAIIYEDSVPVDCVERVVHTQN